MPDYAEAINTHYGQANLSAKILTALQETGKDINALTREDLTSFDEHHGGGREATRELVGLVEVCEGMHVLDIGSGIGGPARTLAAEFGCRVTGLDLTEEFCHAAAMLTERVGLQDQITFEYGSALDMPFDDATFDVVWTQDVLMNIENKGRLFAEVHRVLRPGGRLNWTTRDWSTYCTLCSAQWDEREHRVYESDVAWFSIPSQHGRTSARGILPRLLGGRHATQLSHIVGGMPPSFAREWFPRARMARHNRANGRTGPYAPCHGVGSGSITGWSTRTRPQPHCRNESRRARCEYAPEFCRGLSGEGRGGLRASYVK